MKDSKIKITDPEFDFSCEIARRLIEIGQFDRAKKIIDGLLTIKTNDYLLALWCFINIIKGEYNQVVEQLNAYKETKKKLDPTLTIFQALSEILAGNIRQASMIIGDLKDNIELLNSRQKTALKFLEAYVELYQI